MAKKTYYMLRIDTEVTLKNLATGEEGEQVWNQKRYLVEIPMSDPAFAGQGASHAEISAEVHDILARIDKAEQNEWSHIALSETQYRRLKRAVESPQRAGFAPTAIAQLDMFHRAILDATDQNPFKEPEPAAAPTPANDTADATDESDTQEA